MIVYIPEPSWNLLLMEGIAYFETPKVVNRC